jgi:hypothetical protein
VVEAEVDLSVHLTWVARISHRHTARSNLVESDRGHFTADT